MRNPAFGYTVGQPSHPGRCAKDNRGGVWAQGWDFRQRPEREIEAPGAPNEPDNPAQVFPGKEVMSSMSVP